MTKLGENIRRIRKQKNMKSIELAKQAGVKQPYISAIEKGRKTPSLEVLQKISKALNTSSSELLGEIPEDIPLKVKQLVDTVQDLNDDQMEALIGMVREFTGKYD